MVGYIAIEKALGANMYFENFNDTINYIIVCLKVFHVYVKED